MEMIAFPSQSQRFTAFIIWSVELMAFLPRDLNTLIVVWYLREHIDGKYRIIRLVIVLIETGSFTHIFIVMFLQTTMVDCKPVYIHDIKYMT